MDIFKLYRSFWDWCFENPEKVKPNHIAVYSFAIEHCNRLGWKNKFGFPTSMVMDAVGIKNYRTYINSLNDLVDFGFIDMVEKSKNQYSSNIIALVNFTKANTKALDKATSKQGTKQRESTVESTVESIVSIDKPITNYKETIITQVVPTSADDSFFETQKDEATKFVDWFNTLAKRNFRATKKIKGMYRSRLKEKYTKNDIVVASKNAHKEKYHIDTNFKHLTPEFILRVEKLEVYKNVLRSSLNQNNGIIIQTTN